MGVPSLTVAQMRERVSSRYPEAEPLPDRPALDDLLRAGRDLTSSGTSLPGREAVAYVSRFRETSCHHQRQCIRRAATDRDSDHRRV